MTDAIVQRIAAAITRQILHELADTLPDAIAREVAAQLNPRRLLRGTIGRVPVIGGVIAGAVK